MQHVSDSNSFRFQTAVVMVTRQPPKKNIFSLDNCSMETHATSITDPLARDLKPLKSDLIFDWHSNNFIL